jgi:hypothetical protein
MAPAHVDALVETAPDGISFDGLTVERAGEEYVFRTPNASATDLSADGLRELAAGNPFVTNWYFWHARAPQKDDHWAFLRWLEGAPLDEAEADSDGEPGDEDADEAEADSDGEPGDEDADEAEADSEDGDADEKAMSVPERYDRLADGITTEWGQLRITVTLDGNGGRSYDLRHVADAEASVADLVSYDNPADARELATLDDDGRYRPLKTAPSLGTGWVFPALDAGTLVRAVDFFYPATIANWYREHEGALDVSHWQSTMSRQTGIYGVVETWDRGEGHEHAEWVAEACCADSQCLKRREWEYDDQTDLDAPAGDGAFPCREPCSLVISATRQFLKTDSEETRSYEFDLTPSEKEQLEALVDAVAEGRIDEIREADTREGANRYRTRFLRAKHFDDDGNLCGVPTEAE